MEFFQFYRCMDLIAATLAEGGLVLKTFETTLKLPYTSLHIVVISLKHLSRNDFKSFKKQPLDFLEAP